jgi:putative MATE family efflux protein
MDKTRELETSPLLSLIVKYSIPAIVGMIIQSIYNVVDRYFIGLGVGDKGLAGVVVAFPYMLGFMAFGMLVGIGGVAAFSIFLGQQRRDQARLTLGNAITSSLLFGALLSSLGLAFLEPLLKFFGASTTTFTYAKDYMSIIALGGVFQIFSFALNNFLRAQGFLVSAMVTMFIGALLNLVLDALFILAFGWGVPGAAWATIISMAVSSLWILIILAKTPVGKTLTPRDFVPNLGILGRIFSIGISPFLMQLAMAVINTFLNNQLSRYGGDWALSSIGVIYSVALIFLMPTFGLNQGTQPIIGYNYGAGNFPRVLKVVHTTMLIATFSTTLGFLAAFFFSEQFIAAFLPGHPDIHAPGARALRIFLLAYPFLGIQVAGVGFFQAIGKATHSMVLSLSRQVLLLLPLLIFLPLIWGIDGVWFAAPTADFLAFVITAILLFKELSRFKLHPVKKPLDEPLPPLATVNDIDPLGNPGDVI